MIQGHGDDAYRFARTIRANFSSNVYGRVDLEVLKAHLKQSLDAISHYPEPEPYTLEAALAARHSIDPAAVCVTNGATEAIYLIAHAFSGSRSTILQPTFSEYADACRLYGHEILHSVQDDNRWRKAKQRVGFGLDGIFSAGQNETQSSGASEDDIRWREAKQRVGFGLDSIFSAGQNETQSSGALVWLCNPNNPTGGVIPKEQLRSWIETHPEIIFVIDQSYGFFTQAPLLTAAEASAYPNVLQLHSMTKRYAMPGLRLGYVTAAPQLLERVRAVRMPWSVNALAIEAGLFLCDHPETAPIDLPSLLAETQRLRAQLNALPGLTAEPTQTHFFLCRLATGRACDLKQWLAEKHGILIRDAANFEGLDEGCFRIATQTPEENKLLGEAIRQYLEDNAL